MKTSRASRYLLVVEALVCFALPLYFLFWGLLAMPLLLSGLGSGASYIKWQLFDVVGGVLGTIAILKLLRYCVSARTDLKFRRILIGALALVGVLAAWDAPSNHFTEIVLDMGTLLFAVLPTLCAIHLYVLALQRSRRQQALGEPNNALQPTCEDARG